MRRLGRLLPSAPAARWALLGVTAIVAVNVILAVGGALQPTPSGPAGSSYATKPRGLAAWAELLARAGADVERRRAPLADGRLDPRATLVVLEPRRIAASDTRALRRFLARGGRLVAGGRRPGWLAQVLDAPPRWSAAGPRVARSAPDAWLEPAVRRVRGAGRGSWDAGGAVRPVIVGVTTAGGARPSGGANRRDGARPPGGGNRRGGTDPAAPGPGGAPGAAAALVVEARAGRGRAVLVADVSPLENRLLDRADNAALALALAGPPGRRVVFAEAVHGFGRETGLGAIPTRWRIGLGGLVLAALLWLASRARRLGPAEDAAPAPHPARREHVDALAEALRRRGEPEPLTASLRAAARDRVIARAGLDPRASDEAVRAAALGLGWEEREAAALAGEERAGEEGLVASGRALARTYEERR